MGIKLVKTVVFLTLFSFWGVNTALCQSGSLSNEKESLTKQKIEDNIKEMVSISTVDLANNGFVTIISDYKWSVIGETLVPVFSQVDLEYRKILGNIPDFEVIVRLIDSEKFYEETKAPKWTNAMYHKGQIYIPMNEKNAQDLDNLIRSIRHEYTHAVVNKLSNGRAPGWLDEGLAQQLEGQENKILKPALAEWFAENDAIPFDQLQGGFTKLKSSMVAVAYGQSLYSIKDLITNKGFEGIRTYLAKLSENKDRYTAFRESFQSEEISFQRRLRFSILRNLGN